jgi:hypothetical protein
MAKEYKSFAIGVSKANKRKHEALTGLADKLGCKPSNLVWLAIDNLLQNPPTTAPAGAAPSVGTASGFWVRPVMEDGRAVDVEIVEVANRSDAEGRTFLRYKSGDAKLRNRALNQAKRAAAFDCQMLGIEFDEDNILLLDIPEEDADTEDADTEGADAEDAGE